MTRLLPDHVTALAGLPAEVAGRPLLTTEINSEQFNTSKSLGSEPRLDLAFNTRRQSDLNRLKCTS